MTSQLDLSNIFRTGKDTNKPETFPHAISLKHSMYILENLNKIKKTAITSNNRFLLVLEEFKSDKIFAEKTQLKTICMWEV